LKDAVSDIKGVKSDLKNISDSLSSSRKQISSIVQNLDDSQTRINLITNRVGVLYLDYKKDDSKFRAKTDSITRRLHDEEKSADSLSRELEQLQ
jgi:chromosome segregation ATPase